MADLEASRPFVRVTRRMFLRSAALGTVGLGLLACAPPAPPSPTAAPAKPTEAAKPAAPAATSAPAAAGAAAPAAAPAASPAAAATGTWPGKGETPQRGGELIFVVSAEPDTFDGHKSTTFALIHPISPHYNLLVKFDPDTFPNIVGDLAESWTTAPDGMSMTFKVRDGVKFHDGTPFSSKDVKASYDRIIRPPEGVVSARKQAFAAFDTIETPDPRTVVFRFKYPNPGALNILATPYSYIYSAADLEKNQQFPEKNINGTGPFKYVEYQPGSHWIGKRNEDYWDKGKPYLDSYRALFIRETAAQVAAVRGERAHVEFRGFTPQARDEIKQALGDKCVVQESSWFGLIYATFNTTRAPFSDVRVRRAMAMAIDQWEGAKVLSQIALPKYPGTLVRPDGPFGMGEAKMAEMSVFSKDGNGNKDKARALLKEAGVPDGFSFVFKNRDVPSPYEPVGVFMIDQWRKIGLNPTQQVLETTSYFNDIRAGNFEVSMDFSSDFEDEPDLNLAKFLSTGRSSTNYGKYTDQTLDDLYDKQTRELDAEKRKQLVWQYERRVLDEQAYIAMSPWWQRIIPHSAKMKGWRILPSHYLNQDLSNVWLTG